MTRAEANLKATEMFGDTAFAIRIRSRNRNERFGVLVVQSGQVGPLGYGATWEEAFNMAEQTVAKAKQKEQK